MMIRVVVTQNYVLKKAEGCFRVLATVFPLLLVKKLSLLSKSAATKKYRLLVSFDQFILGKLVKIRKYVAYILNSHLVPTTQHVKLRISKFDSVV